MSVPTAWDRLTLDEKVLTVYLLLAGGYALAEMFFSSGGDTSSTTVRVSHDEVVLDERELQHLEAGGSVTRQRWHGGEVELSATQVVDVEELPADDAED